MALRSIGDQPDPLGRRRSGVAGVSRAVVTRSDRSDITRGWTFVAAVAWPGMDVGMDQVGEPFQ
jgi:hypothetical protein